MFPTGRQYLLIGLSVMFSLSACEHKADELQPPGVVTTTAGASGETDDIPRGQLPTDVLPVAYQLTLTIVPQEDSFQGTAVIDMEVTGSKNYFYLHGKNLLVHQVQLSSEGNTFDAIYKQVDESGIVKISSPRALQGNVRLRIQYEALFNQALEGLYKVSESGGDYAYTQFESISARLAFPGFDEPRFKTPFDITLIVPASHVAIANTPEISSNIIDGMKHVHFAPTKPLPSYLIAFAVGDFDVIEYAPLPATDIRPHPLPLRGIAVKGKGDQLEYALAGTNTIVTALESYFATPYPWAKLDILAVPDFDAGAMENVGAITYRESLLLFDDTATPMRKRRYKMVHTHELSHQWFGDLVTPLWWNDIWLNEAFATWMAHVAMDMAEPQQNYRRDLLTRGVRVMAGDSLVNARQIRQPILSNNDIATAFDGITYSKGGAVLAMFESFLGREDFRQGVRNYMREFQYGSASADDFIRHLAQAATRQPGDIVTESFNSFLEQPGLPLVEFTPQCTHKGASIDLKQSRYFPFGSQGDDDQQWIIPVCLRLGYADESTTNCLVLSEKEQHFGLGQACPDWIIPNVGGAGYYRFSLDKEAWKNLLANSDKQSTEELMVMVGSLSGAFDSGEIDIASLMSIAPQLIARPAWQLSTAPVANMKFIYERLASASQKRALEQRFSSLFSDKLEATGLDASDDRDQAQLQALLVEFLAETARQSELRAELVKIARAYSGYGMDNKLHPDAANPGIVATALGVAVDELGNDFVDHLQRLLMDSTDAVVRGRLLGAMANSKDPVKAPEILELVFSPVIRDNEIFSILYPQASMQETREATWSWFQKNMPQILERIPEERGGRMTFIGNAFCDPAKKAEVQAFFSARIDSLTGGPRNLAKTLERIDLCMAKVRQHQPELDVWLGQ